MLSYHSNNAQAPYETHHVQQPINASVSNNTSTLTSSTGRVTFAAVVMAQNTELHPLCCHAANINQEQ